MSECRTTDCCGSNDFAYAVETGSAQPAPSADCRSTDCCTGEKGLPAVLVSPEGGSTSGCVAPSANLAVDNSSLTCGQSALLAWNTLDVGAGGWVTISGGVGSVTPDQLGSQSVTPTVTTTYTLTAHNDCGETTASVTVVVVTPTVTISASHEEIDCGTAVSLSLSYQTANFAAAAVATISASPALSGFPVVVAVNEPNVLAVATLPTTDTTFTLSVTDACGTQTDSVDVLINYVTPTFTFIQNNTGACTVQLAWTSLFCGPATIELKGPGFGDGATYTEVTPNSSIVIDPTSGVLPTMFALGTDNGFWAQYYGKATGDGTVLQTGPDVCLAPKAAAIWVDNYHEQPSDNTYVMECKTSGGDTILEADVIVQWEAWWAGNGIEIYDQNRSLLATDTGVEVNGYYNGEVTITIHGDTVMYLVPKDTCHAACQIKCMTVQLECSASCDNAWYTPAEIACGENAAVGLDAGPCMGDQVKDAGEYPDVWDGIWHYDAPTNHYHPPSGQRMTDGNGRDPEDPTSTRSHITDIYWIYRSDDYNGLGCGWVIHIEDGSVVPPTVVEYFLAGKSPIGVYTKNTETDPDCSYVDTIQLVEVPNPGDYEGALDACDP